MSVQKQLFEKVTKIVQSEKLDSLTPIQQIDILDTLSLVLIDKRIHLISQLQKQKSCEEDSEVDLEKGQVHFQDELNEGHENVKDSTPTV